MYFIPRNGALYTFIAHIQPPYRFLLTGLVIALISSVWFFHIYQRIDALNQQYQQEMNHFQQQQEKCLLAEETSAQLRQEIRTLKRDLHQFYEQEYDVPTHITQILNAATHAHLSFNGYTVEKGIEGEQTNTHKISINFLGTPDQLMTFLNAVEKINTLAAYNTITTTKNSDGNITISCLLTLTTFR